jgi:FixJ family two-component response regulator
VLTSGFADDVARTGAHDDGGLEVLRKPYSREELARAIRQALEQRGR